MPWSQLILFKFPNTTIIFDLLKFSINLRLQRIFNFYKWSCLRIPLQNANEFWWCISSLRAKIEWNYSMQWMPNSMPRSLWGSNSRVCPNFAVNTYFIRFPEVSYWLTGPNELNLVIIVTYCFWGIDIVRSNLIQKESPKDLSLRSFWYSNVFAVRC